MADTTLVQYSPPPHNPVTRVFNSARLTWINEPGTDLTVLDYKGTDRVIHGLALFKERYRLPLKIRLVRIGRHVTETRQLIDRLGLSDQVTWLDYLTQIQFRDEVRAADIVIDQVADGTVAMSGLEALAAGRPLIANARAEVIAPVLGAPSPICQASSAEEVCEQLHRLVSSAEERVRLGIVGREYVEKYFSADAVAARLLRKLAALGMTVGPVNELTKVD
jgi:glycosyltransferase involved in cell wall biosynthesis